MPYITQLRRAVLDDGAYPRNPGELNYAITKLVADYTSRALGDMTYQRINDVLGALEGVKLEFYRRVAAPYENGKLSINGDVYGT